MGARNRQPLPFGQGIDRASGAMVVDPSVFNDIRNVHLNRGRSEMRKGLLRALLIPAPWTDLLGVYLIRAQGLAGAVVYDSASRRVGLFAIDSSGVASAYVDDLWTLPAGATSPPRITATDSYDQLIIAHDEPVYPVRQGTMVYSAVESTIGPMLLDLGRTGTPEGAKFRGVAKHLAYLLGWGYGTNQVEQGDRGEVLRISMPGEPTNFIPEHYFLVGTQGDPIIGGGPCNRQFAVQKIASSYLLRGYDRQSFGIEPLDPKYGLASARLGVGVNAEWFHWSLSGPRSTDGSASSDLGLPLELAGPVPDPLASVVAQENGFAYYDPTEREVIFCFGQWAYVLHLKDGDRRWSYRVFSVPLVNAGLLYVGGNLGLSNIVAHPEPGVLSYTEPTYGAGDGDPKITVPWNTIGGAITGEKTEVWAQSTVAGSPWRRKASVAAGAGTATFKVDGFLTTYNIALRFVSGGFAGAGYTSANPANWPAVSRTTFTTGGEMTAFALGKWRRYTSISQGFDVVNYAGPGVNASTAPVGLTFRVERSDDGGATWALMQTGVSYANLPSVVRYANSDSLISSQVRARVEGPNGVGAWFLPGARIIAPEPPSALVVGATDLPGGANNVDDHHVVSWSAPAAVNGEAPADGPYEMRGRHYLSTTYGSYGSVLSVGVGVHTVGGYTTPGGAFPGVDRYAEMSVRTVLVSGDVSPYVINNTAYDP